AFKTNRQYIVIDAKSNLGTYYWKIGKFSKAIELLISADSFYTQKNINNISVLTSLSRAYFMAGEIEKSRLYFEKIKPDDNLLNNIENKILGMSLENKSDTYRDFVLYKSLLDSNVIEETKLQVRALNKKFKLLEKENEIKRLNEINLLNKTKSQNLEVEFFKQSIENDKLSKEKMVVENELKDKAIIEISNKLEITTLNAVKKLSDLKLQEQKKVAFGSIFGFVIISILSIFIYLQSQNRKETNLKIKKKKDQIQLLHQELNHRVKNNLSFMTSLIEMQGRRTQNVEAREILQETENRLGALSLVHSNLFKNDSATTVNLAYYLEELVSQLEKICTIPDKALKCNCDFTDHYVNAEDAMRLGLIVNELVTNSVKHAFQNVDEPLINISTSIDKDGKLVLEYRDNGPGTTQVTNNVVNEKNDHFGTKLIALLREQMKNRYTVNWGSSI
ncbi:MAG: sensor histidine kinase, partial [Saprospiraceae bacterium]|nr:sensor histidine kinase [Saprospiraceae bacterium]